jgi:hypothetical protein
MPNSSVLLPNNESLFDREDNLPLEEGLIVGNSYTFFNEFFLIIIGLF